MLRASFYFCTIIVETSVRRTDILHNHQLEQKPLLNVSCADAIQSFGSVVTIVLRWGDATGAQTHIFYFCICYLLRQVLLYSGYNSFSVLFSFYCPCGPTATFNSTIVC